jgi:hypothetical protein
LPEAEPAALIIAPSSARPEEISITISFFLLFVKVFAEKIQTFLTA